MQSKGKEIKATKWLSRDEFNRQQDVERERYRKELQEKGGCKAIKVIKWLVFGLFFYFCMIPFMLGFIGGLMENDYIY
jgi:hypothetical protein